MLLSVLRSMSDNYGIARLPSNADKVIHERLLMTASPLNCHECSCSHALFVFIEHFVAGEDAVFSPGPVK